jgi:uncharacterized protein (TIRG00374 family)
LGDEIHTAAPSRSWLRLGLQAGLLAAAVAALVLYFTFDEATWDHLKRLDAVTALELAGLVVMVWLCGGGRVVTLARGLGYRLSYPRGVAVILSSEFGMAATPAGAGGAALWLGLLRSFGIPVSHGAALLMSEVTIDVGVFLLLLPFGLWALIRQPELRASLAQWLGEIWFYPVILVAVVAALAVLLTRLPSFAPLRRWLWSRRGLRRGLVRLTRLWRQRHRFLHRLRGGLHTLFRLRPGFVGLAVLLALVQWTCRYSILPLLVWRFGGSSEVLVLILLQGLLLTLSYLIVAPGGGGGVEVAAVLLLGFFAPAPAVGVIVVLWRFYTYHLFLLVGGVTFALTLAAERRRVSSPPGPAPSPRSDRRH